MAGRVAILIDAENVLAAERHSEDVKIETLVSDLRAHYRPVAHLQTFLGIRAPAGVLHRLHALNVQTIVSRGIDSHLALAAVAGMELLEDVDELVLVSGDADFVPLLGAAERAGKRTIIVSPIRQTSAALATVANERLTPDQLTGARGTDRHGQRR